MDVQQRVLLENVYHALENGRLRREYTSWMRPGYLYANPEQLAFHFQKQAIPTRLSSSPGSTMSICFS
jgi:hypothetical protein